MSEYKYRVTIRTEQDYEIRITLLEDYYEAISTALERAIEYRDICDPQHTTIDTMLNDRLIRREKLFNITEKDKILATVLNLIDKARITDDLELAIYELLIVDQWNKKAIPSARIEYRIAYIDFKVIIIVEGYHYGFQAEV